MAAADHQANNSNGTKSKAKKKKKSGKVKPEGQSAKIEHEEESKAIDDEEAQEERDVPKPNQGSPITASINESPAEPDPAEVREHQLEGPAKILPLTEAASGLTIGVDGIGAVKDRLAQDSSNEDSNMSSLEKITELNRVREDLRNEIVEARRSLEDLRRGYEEQLGSLKKQVNDADAERDSAKAQYDNLLGRVNTIKSQLGDRLKADAEDLRQARVQIEELEEENIKLKEENEHYSRKLDASEVEVERQGRELSSLRDVSILSQQNFSKEREDLMQHAREAEEEFEAAKQAMQDWETLAKEERSIRESVTSKITDMEEQIVSYQEMAERHAADEDTQSGTIEGLQRALQQLQEARRQELHESVESSQKEIGQLQKSLGESERRATEALSELGSAKENLSKALPYEKEVKEKNLLIGKLRHEAVILNDHLTKALRFLRKSKPEDSIDKQLVTNHFLQFLALDRSDPKKFQVLQIIASLLNWDDEQREQGGLSRPGTSNPNSKIPLSPWHRISSTSSLSAGELSSSRSTANESLAGLWSEFLDREAREKVASPTSPSNSSTAVSSIQGHGKPA